MGPVTNSTTDKQFNDYLNFYRYLRSRPKVFLHRNISYMKLDEVNRNIQKKNPPRKHFKVDNLLEKFTEPKKGIRKRSKCASIMPTQLLNKTTNCLTIEVKCIYNSKLPRGVSIQLDVYLVAVNHKVNFKSSPMVRVKLVSSKMLRTNNGQLNPGISDFSPIVIKRSAFNKSKEVQQFSLVFVTSSFTKKVVNDENFDINQSIQSVRTSQKEFSRACLVLINKGNACLLTDGDYELVFTKCQKIYTNTGHTWQVVENKNDLETFYNTSKLTRCDRHHVFNSGVVLNYSILWQDKKGDIQESFDYTNGDSASLSGFSSVNGEGTSSNQSIDLKNDLTNEKKRKAGFHLNIDELTDSRSFATTIKDDAYSTVSERVLDFTDEFPIVKKEIETTNNFKAPNNNHCFERNRYRIIMYRCYYKSGQQEDIRRTTFHCFFCSINGYNLLPLLYHIHKCHEKFDICYIPISEDVVRIELRIKNKCNPSSQFLELGCVFNPSFNINSWRPRNRKGIETEVFVSKMRRELYLSLSDFNKVNIENRNPEHRFYSSTSNAVLEHHQIKYDSDDEVGPPWLLEYRNKLIDEFPDVNEGEKMVMKMWNEHIMLNPNEYLSDQRIPLACERFIENYSYQICEMNLVRNTLIHFANLSDWNLLNSAQLLDLIRQFHLKVNAWVREKDFDSD